MKLRGFLPALFVLSLLSLVIAKDPCCQNDPNCNPTNCTCFADLQNGFWKMVTQGNDTKCTECLDSYNFAAGCKNCTTPNFDPSQNCTSCTSGFYGSSCSVACNSDTCNPFGGACSSTGSCQCFRNITRGFWEGERCAGCLNNYDVTKNCTECRKNWIGETCSKCFGNFDETQDCLKCKPGYYGDDCSATCDAQAKCAGNGFCSGDDCVCFSDPTRGYWDISTNCRTCLKGWEGSECKNAICTATDRGVCNGHGKCVEPEVCECNGFFVGAKCELKVCYDIPENETTKVCSGNGQCLGFNDCYCYWGSRGSDCSEYYMNTGWGIALQVLIGIAVFSVFFVFVTIICLFRKKVENPTRVDQINWVELQESDEEISGLGQ